MHTSIPDSAAVTCCHPLRLAAVAQYVHHISPDISTPWRQHAQRLPPKQLPALPRPPPNPSPRQPPGAFCWRFCAGTRGRPRMTRLECLPRQGSPLPSLGLAGRPPPPRVERPPDPDPMRFRPDAPSPPLFFLPPLPLLSPAIAQAPRAMRLAPSLLLVTLLSPGPLPPLLLSPSIAQAPRAMRPAPSLLLSPEPPPPPTVCAVSPVAPAPLSLLPVSSPAEQPPLRHTYMYMYMYVCIYMCIYGYMHVYKYICAHVYIHACIHTCMHAYIHAYIHTHTLTIHTHTHTHTHTYIHACIHAYIQTYKHSYVNTHEQHSHTHIYGHSSVKPPQGMLQRQLHVCVHLRSCCRCGGTSPHLFNRCVCVCARARVSACIVYQNEKIGVPPCCTTKDSSAIT